MRSLPAFVAFGLLLAAPELAARAQPVEVPNLPDPAPVPSSGAFTQQQLDDLVGRIALYPDPVLTDILAASTFPAQVVEAERFIRAGGATRAATPARNTTGKDWDPSVQALLSFPDLLHMMDADLDWTDRLGRAVSLQQSDVLDAIQRLRQVAESAGTLQNGPQESVVNDGGNVALLLPSPQQVYIPTYQAGCVYGQDAGGADCSGAADDIGWGDSIFLPYGYVQWGLVDWRHRDIRFGNDHEGAGAAGDRGSGGHFFGRPPGAHAVWRAALPRHFTALNMAGNIGGGADRFHYAPPAAERMHQQGYAAALPPAQNPRGAVLHGPAGKPAAIRERAATAIHAGGVGHDGGPAGLGMRR